MSVRSEIQNVLHEVVNYGLGFPGTRNVDQATEALVKLFLEAIPNAHLDCGCREAMIEKIGEYRMERLQIVLTCCCDTQPDKCPIPHKLLDWCKKREATNE